MKTIDVSFKGAEILLFDARTGAGQMRIIINDGKDKAMVKEERFDKDPQSWALSVMHEVRQKLKAANSERSLEDDPLAGHVAVRFRKDEEELQQSLAKFYIKAHDQIRSAKMSKLSYYEMEKKIVGMKALF